MKRRYAELVPSFMRPAARFIFHLPGDMVDSFRGRGPMTPPKSLRFVGSGDFETIGNEYFGLFVGLGKLRPTDRVLDVGCGVGRMAVPLTRYMTREGEYWGFDVVKRAIVWCRKHITREYPNFHFTHCDLRNESYNPHGKLSDCDYRFPFESAYFDFVFLTSVFTHLLPGGLENYMSEISRVLRPGGRCLSTFFLMNEEASQLIADGRSTLDFKYELDGCRTIDKQVPELSVAYPEDGVKKLFVKSGLEMELPVHYGSWPGRTDFLSYQDIIMAERCR